MLQFFTLSLRRKNEKKCLPFQHGFVVYGLGLEHPRSGQGRMD
jgi:hypothetical protein